MAVPFWIHTKLLIMRMSYSGSKALSKAQNGGFTQPDVDSDTINMLPTEEELLTCDCPFCVAYRGRSGSVRGSVAGELLQLKALKPMAATVAFDARHGMVVCPCVNNVW